MKKLSVLVASVLLCTQVFAGGTEDPKTSTASSASAVTKVAGSKIVKLYYKSETTGNVDVTIFNSSGQEVFSESLSKTNGFSRPYNFERLPEGEYTIAIKDDHGKMVEKILYAEAKIQKQINVKKLQEDDKYLVTINSSKADDVTILISDADNNLIYTEAVKVDGDFGKIYHIKDVKNFTLEVIDSNGVLKSIKY